MIKYSLRFFLGYMVLQIPSISHERFINICSSRNIRLWDIRQKDGLCTFSVLWKDYKNLDSILVKTGTDSKIIDKKGIPSIYLKYKNHNSFLIGVILYFAVLYALTLFTWDIKVIGAYTYTEKEITDALLDAGIKHGMPIGEIKCEELERFIRNKYFDITWVSAEIEGTKLNIYIKENEDTFTKDEVKKKPTSIISNSTGTITHMVTRAGTPMVTIGTAVKEGDMLVNSKIDILNDYKEIIRSDYISADADIIGETSYEYNKKINRKYIKKVYTGREKTIYRAVTHKDSYRFEIGNIDFDKYDTYSEYSSLAVGRNFYLPVQIAKVTYREYEEVKAEYTDREMESILTGELDEFIRNLIEKGIQINEKDVKIDTAKKHCILSGNIFVTQSFVNTVTAEPEPERNEPEDEHN